MVADSAVSRLVAQYEAASELRDVLKQTKHLEQTSTDKRSVLEKVQRPTNTMQEMSNHSKKKLEICLVWTPRIQHPQTVLRGLLLTFPLEMHPLRSA